MTQRTETITWHDVATEGPPDDDTTVLLDWDTADPWMGWFDNDGWHQVDGMSCDPPQRWAHMPEGCAR